MTATFGPCSSSRLLVNDRERGERRLEQLVDALTVRAEIPNGVPRPNP